VLRRDPLLSAADNWLQDLVCPNCHSLLKRAEQRLYCDCCGKAFPIRDGIPDFRERDEYWCNVSREKMLELNELAKKTGDWLGSARSLIPNYFAHFKDFDRADLQFLWPCTSESRILDAGSMWGGLTIPAAQYHREVYAVDKTLETLSFLKIRADQMGYSNIYPIACPLRHLPFPNDYFDLVILSGVLEWVALEQDLILENHWGKRRSDRHAYSEDPRSVQINVLREISRVLKPEGALYLAIENSIGFKYLMGYPDDHVNIPFVSFLPRKIANAITQLVLNCEYRTYVYSVPGYRSLLQESGLEAAEMYGSLDHYISPRCAVPLNMMAGMKNDILNISGRWARLFFSPLPGQAMKHLVASVITIAKKESSQSIGSPRIVTLLRQCGLVNSKAIAPRVIKWNSRPGTSLPVNYLIYADGSDKPTYFCKICRSRGSTHVVEHEASNLEDIHQRLQHSELRTHIPRVLHYGDVDGITFMAMSFLDGQMASFAFGRSLSEYVQRDLVGKTESAIQFLSEFQMCTRSEDVQAASYLRSAVERHRELLRTRNALTSETGKLLDSLCMEIDELDNYVIPLVAVHGDFDFFFNVLLSKEGVQVVDFEHYEACGLPFLDLGALLFTPMLVSREYVRDGLALARVFDKFDLHGAVSLCLSKYSKVTGISWEILRLLPPLVALEAQGRIYPETRDPSSFPLRGERPFQDLLKLRLRP
jgi:SAM-dependent methyltransferase